MKPLSEFYPEWVCVCGLRHTVFSDEHFCTPSDLGNALSFANNCSVNIFKTQPHVEDSSLCS